MIKEDKLYLAKTIYDYVDAIKKSQSDLNNTSEFINAIIEGLGVHDGRNVEVLMYQSNVKTLLEYAQSHGILHTELLALIEEYKTLSFVDYFAVKEKVTIADELEALLKRFY